MNGPVMRGTVQKDSIVKGPVVRQYSEGACNKRDSIVKGPVLTGTVQ